MQNLFADVEQAAELVDGLRLVTVRNDRRNKPHGDIVFVFELDQDRAKELRYRDRDGLWSVDVVAR